MAPAPLKFLVITGQTASGKERAALAVAECLGGEIISMDSMKVYRGMDIGTATADAEARSRVPHHLLDVADPWESFSTPQWGGLAEPALADIAARGRVPVVSGGTVLYLKALLYGLFEGPSADQAIRDRLRAEADSVGTAALHDRLRGVDPAAAERIHPNDLRRIVRALEVYELTGRPISQQQQQFGNVRSHLDPLMVALRRNRDDLRRRIDQRVDRMVAAGLEDEVRRLLSSPQGLSREARQAVGYREMIDLLEGRLSRDEAIAQLKKNTATFARRQMTHLRSLDGKVWIDLGPTDSAGATADRIIDLWRSHTGAG
jgi:tRNA dimethylallyltransferase